MVTETDAPLRSYVRAKQTVAQALREAQDFLRRANHPGGADRLHALLSRLAEDRFHLVVLGQFKRGKSSLINAVVGRELLPTASVPLTSVVTALHYGPVERAIIRRQGWTLAEGVPVSALAEFVTERGNPRNEKRVLSAEIEVPAPFLRRGLRFIDTPGIGSIHEHNTATTYAFLPEADAAIFITSAESPLTEAELTFLDAIRQHVRKLFFVLNKVDQLEAAELGEVVAYAEQALAARTGAAGVRLFPLSARQALAAKAAADDAVLAASGLLALEAALATFLTNERGAVFLTALLDRALRLLDEVRFALDLGQAAQRRPAEDVAERLAQLRRRLDALEGERGAAIARLRPRLDAWRDATLGPALDRFAVAAQRTLEAELALQTKTREHLDADSYYTQLLTWIRARLGEQARGWLEEHAVQIERAARELGAAEQPALAAAVQRVAQSAAAAFGVSEQRGSAADASGGQVGGWGDGDAGTRGHGDTGTRGHGEDGWRWRPPPFDPAGVQRSLDAASQDALDAPLFLPLPRSLARRAALRAVRRKLPALADDTAAALRRCALDYLEWALHEISRSSASAAAAARRQIEQAFGPETGSAAGAGQIGTGHAARRTELERLVTRLTDLRDALLRTGTVPDESPEASAPDGSAAAAVGAMNRAPTRGRPATDGRAGAAGAGGTNGTASAALPPAAAGTASADPAATRSRGEELALSAAKGSGAGDALALGTCPLCAPVLDAVHSFLCHWQYRLATDAAAQREFRAAGGLCAAHTWQLERVSSPRGLCSGYPPLLEQTAERVRALTGLPAAAAGRRVGELLPRPDTCAACLVRQRAEHTATARLAAVVVTPAGRAAFDRSHGLCLAHLQLVLPAIDEEVASALLRAQGQNLARVAEAMHGYALKFDARRRELLTAEEEEEEAYRRALILLVGERHVV